MLFALSLFFSRIDKMSSAEPVIRSRRTEKEVNGISTQVVCTEFSNYIFVVLTQYGKIGTLVSVTSDSRSNDISTPTFSTKVLLGKEEVRWCCCVLERDLRQGSCHAASRHLEMGNGNWLGRLGSRKTDSVRKWTRALACHYYKWGFLTEVWDWKRNCKWLRYIFDHYSWYGIYCFLKVFLWFQISRSCRSGVFILRNVSHCFSSVMFPPPHFCVLLSFFVWFQPMTHVCAKHLATFVSQEASNRPVLLGLALKESSIDAIKQMQELIQSCKVW